MRRTTFVRQTVVLALVLVLFGFLLMPVWIMLISSLKPLGDVQTPDPTWLPVPTRLQNYADIWSDIPLLTYLKNSAIVALSSTGLVMTLAIPSAYTLARFSFLGRRPYMFALLTTQMFSPVVIIIPLYRFMRTSGLYDTLIAVIVADAAISMAFATWMLTGYFRSIPKDIEEAVWVDGGTRRDSLLRVVVPLSAPGLVTTAIYTFILAWNQFILPLSFVSSPEKQVVVVGLYDFVNEQGVQWNLLMASVVVAVIPVIILFTFVQRYLTEGLVGGATKG
jgi:multiple sugar transport system permease protein